MRIPTKSKRFCCGTAFTIIEVLVSITVISIMVAILLPAIMAARETARNLSCMNNLHQIGVAVHSFESTNKVFPNGNRLMTEILPFAENANLEKSLPDSTIGPAFAVCASDWNADRHYLRISYRVNAGSTLNLNNGIYQIRAKRGLRIAEVIDGCSNTAMLAEKLVLQMNTWRDPSQYSPESQPLRWHWLVDRHFSDDDAFVNWCRSIPINSTQVSSIYEGWDSYDSEIQLPYNHLMPPGVRSFLNITRQGRPITESGGIPPTSLHSGGRINILRVDGSQTNVGSNVDLSVWRALGSRNGHEVTSEP